MPDDGPENSELVIRIMAASDWAVIRPVRLRALSDAPTAFGSSYAVQSMETDTQWIERVRHLTDPQCAATWLAWEGESPVGMVAGVEDAKVPGRAWLISMWVAPEARRRGVGRRLIQHVIDWAGERGMRALHLHVTDGNDLAQRLYEHMGFRLTGDTMPHPRIADLLELEMRHVLTP